MLCLHTKAEDSKAQQGLVKRRDQLYLPKVGLVHMRTNKPKRARQRQSSTSKDQKRRKTLTLGDIRLRCLTQGTKTLGVKCVASIILSSTLWSEESRELALILISQTWLDQSHHLSLALSLLNRYSQDALIIGQASLFVISWISEFFCETAFWCIHRKTTGNARQDKNKTK